MRNYSSGYEIRDNKFALKGGGALYDTEHTCQLDVDVKINTSGRLVSLKICGVAVFYWK